MDQCDVIDKNAPVKKKRGTKRKAARPDVESEDDEVLSGVDNEEGAAAGPVTPARKRPRRTPTATPASGKKRNVNADDDYEPGQSSD